jgi:glycosyltransferase involved in cell wall biosynthesis
VKKKIVIIGHYKPSIKVGGPVVSVVNLVNFLSSVFDFYILAPSRDFGESKKFNGVIVNKWCRIDNVVVKYLSSGLLGSLQMLINLKRLESDYTSIYLNSFFNFRQSILIVLLNKLHIIRFNKIVIATRGELFDESLRHSKRKKYLFLKICKSLRLYKGVFWHATNDREKEYIALNMLIRPEFIRVAYMIPDLSFSDNVDGTLISDDSLFTLRLVYLARIVPEKNLIFALETLSNLKFQVEYDLYGPIEDKKYWELCQTYINRLPTNVKVNYKGILVRKEIPSVLKRYDMLFLPTFSENFGHSIVESLIVGTPVLISNNTPWRNLEIQNFGWDLDLDDITMFISVLNEYSKWTPEDRIALRRNISRDIQIKLGNMTYLEDNIALFDL